MKHARFGKGAVIRQPNSGKRELGVWVTSAAMVATFTLAAPGVAFAVDGVAAPGSGTANTDIAGPSTGAMEAGEPLRYDCIDSWSPRTLAVPTGVIAYQVVATAGSGTHGHNDSRGGVGAQVKGTINVEGLASLDLWVGCSGYDFDGAGYGHRGGGGSGGGGTATGLDGGDGGGASMIAVSSPFTPLLAAGGGGGAGGDGENYDGGMGGSGGGTNHTSWPYDGGQGGNDGGNGGKANSHTSQGQPSPDGGAGGESGFGSGGGGGGGAGYPSGGGGGHSTANGGGGGGGAGGSYLTSSPRVSDGTITVATGYGSGRIVLTPMTRATDAVPIDPGEHGDPVAPVGVAPANPAAVPAGPVLAASGSTAAIALLPAGMFAVLLGAAIAFVRRRRTS